jgi:uncharacterized protein (TIGR00730 family)
MDVGVFGSSRPAEGDPAYEDARRLGRELARRGARVVCGGYGGVMEAACRGAAESGGATRGVVLAGRGRPNAWVQEATIAADLGDRLRLLRDSSNAWIFLPHGLGTMLELLWMAESVVKNEAPPRPLVLVGEFWRALVDTALGESASPPGADALRHSVRFTATVPEAVSAALGES